jgi:hypothetical protein
VRLLALLLLCACGIGCGVPPEGRYMGEYYIVVSSSDAHCPVMHLGQRIDCLMVHEDQDQWVEREWHSPQEKWEILENDY